MITLSQLLTIDDFEARAREILPQEMFSRMFGAYGAPYWVSNTSNLDAFDAIKLRPRVLTGSTPRDLSTEVLGQKISLPIMLGAADHHTRAHPQGELASARAAGSMGTILGVATGSGYSIEEIAEVATGPLWFQLYFLADREIDKELVQRAERAGYSALLLTVDNQVPHSTPREERYTYFLESENIWKNLSTIERAKSFKRHSFADNWEMSLSWSDVEWLRSITSMPIVIKGVQTAEDAALCVENGVDGVLVSNHGGHGAENTIGTIDMLPEVVDAVNGKIDVFLDGGIRRGRDVLKALAIGAKAVFVGRAMFWGLAIDGEAGVRRALEILRHELDVAMGLCGVTDVKSVPRNLVAMPNDSNGSGVVSELERLAALVEKGHLTKAEFETQKARLLGS